MRVSNLVFAFLSFLVLAASAGCSNDPPSVLFLTFSAEGQDESVGFLEMDQMGAQLAGQTLVLDQEPRIASRTYAIDGFHVRVDRLFGLDLLKVMVTSPDRSDFVRRIGSLDTLTSTICHALISRHLPVTRVEGNFDAVTELKCGQTAGASMAP